MPLNTLQAYVTTYRDVDEVTRRAGPYRRVAKYFPITLSLNASGHRCRSKLAVDILKLWDVIAGSEGYRVNEILPEQFLAYLRQIRDARPRTGMSLRVVGLYEEAVTISDHAGLEEFLSRLLLSPADGGGLQLDDYCAARHFSNIAKSAPTSHVWIIGQGDYPSESALEKAKQLLEGPDCADLISFAISHSIERHHAGDRCFDRIQMRELEALSGSIYRTSWLHHIPETGRHWWPHLESVIEAGARLGRPPQHLIVGGCEAGSDIATYVFVEPDPEWQEESATHDDVLRQRFRICLDQVAQQSPHCHWVFGLDELRTAERLCQAGKLTAQEVELFWQSVASDSAWRIQLGPRPPVVVVFDGALEAQRKAAALYLQLAQTGHATFADLSPLDPDSQDPGSASEVAWPLARFGIERSEFSRPPTPRPPDAVLLNPAADQSSRLADFALAQPGIRARLQPGEMAS